MSWHGISCLPPHGAMITSVDEGRFFCQIGANSTVSGDIWGSSLDRHLVKHVVVAVDRLHTSLLSSRGDGSVVQQICT